MNTLSKAKTPPGIGRRLISESAEVVERDITPESENLKSGSWGSISAFARA
jgi:hypothetical protein